MNVLDICLLLSVLLASVYMGQIFWRERRYSYKFLSLVLMVMGFAFFLAQASQYIVTSDTQQTSASDFTAVPNLLGHRVVSLNMNSVFAAGERFDVSQTRLKDKLPNIGELRDAVYILDAAQGLLPENKEIVEKIFPGIKLIEVKETKLADICWVRNSLFSIATGECQKRQVKWFIDPSSEDLTRSEKSLSTVRIAEYGKSRWVLVTHIIPLDKMSVEEKCLNEINKGQICAAVEILPSAATAALQMVSSDPVIESVIEEFDAAVPKALNESLSMYANIDTPVFENIQMGKDDYAECGGVFLGQVTKLKILNLDSVSKKIADAENESKLASEAKDLNRFLNCPGLSKLTLPKFKKRDLKISARSFMTYAKRHSFWFTDDKSFLNRWVKVSKVQLQTDSNGERISFTEAQKLKNLSLSFVLPARYAEEMLQSITVANPAADWNVYRTGVYGFRMSFDKLAKNTVVDLSSFFKSLKGNQLGFKNFFASVGVLVSLQLAFVLAVLLTFVHITSSAKPVFWALTFIPVWGITFVLIFLSIVSSRTPSGNDASLARMENPWLPSHAFFSSWPDQWFEENLVKQAQFNASQLKQAEKWAKALREGTQANSVSSGSGVNYLSQDLIYQTSTSGNKNVVVWDHPQARNFYFRKSSIYQSLILGWREIISTHKQVEISSAPDFSALKSLLKNSVLVIPDIRFLSDGDINDVEQFVKTGGILVFSEGLDSESTTSEFKVNGDFANTLKEAGFTNTVASNYSRVNIEGVSISSINVAHRLARKDGKIVNGRRWGTGSVVFVGVQPLESQSRRFLVEILGRLQGQKKTIANVGAGCATALFVQPWAASTSELDIFSRIVRQAGYDLKWILDPVSLAKMAPQWEHRLRADGVVFLDDGKGASRNLAGELLNTLLGAKARPIFVTLTPEAKVEGTGPDSDMIAARMMAVNEISYQAQLWKSECRLGVAKPRFLSGEKMSGLNQVAQTLRSQGPEQLLGLNDYLQRLRDLQSHGATNESKSLKYNLENPLELIAE